MNVKIKELTLSVAMVAVFAASSVAMAADEAPPPPADNAVSSGPAATDSPAATGGESPDTAAAVAKIGKKVDHDATIAIFAPLQPADRYDGVSIKRDIQYGPDGMQRLDVFRSETPGSGKPVFVFLHGGGWSKAGDKQVGDSPFNDNVGLWAVKNGLVGINADYRILPDAHYPDDVEDVALLVRWIKEHAEEYGGDPTKIFLWGHSTGAAEVGDYIAAMARGMKDAGIAGAILTSGYYDLDAKDPRWQRFYGDDTSKWKHIESMPQLVKTAMPVMFSDAEFDPDYYQEQTQAMVQTRKDAGEDAPYVHLTGQSHLSEVYSIGSPDERLSSAMLAFVRKYSDGGETASN